MGLSFVLSRDHRCDVPQRVRLTRPAPCGLAVTILCNRETDTHGNN